MKWGVPGSAVLAAVGIACAQQPVDYVDAMIGAVTYRQDTKDVHGLGKTFPGAATPFGLVQLSPDTFTGGDNGSGYSYEHPTIEGFSFTHMSGVGWYGDLGNFLVTPTTGALKTNRGDPEKPETGYRARFSHETEVARAGYYAATLSDYGIRAELAAAPHAGILRFTFPEHQQSRIQIDLSRRVGGTSTGQYVEVVDDQTIRGWMKCPPEGGGWGNGAGQADYTVYFYCQFSKPLARYGIWRAEIPADWTRKRPDIESAVYHAIIDGRESPAERHFCPRCASALWVYDPRWPELLHPFASAIDTDLPQPPERTHLMLGSKANWVEPDIGADDKSFDEYPDESIAQWHQRLQLTR